MIQFFQDWGKNDTRAEFRNMSETYFRTAMVGVRIKFSFHFCKKKKKMKKRWNSTEKSNFLLGTGEIKWNYNVLVFSQGPNGKDWHPASKSDPTVSNCSIPDCCSTLLMLSISMSGRVYLFLPEGKMTKFLLGKEEIPRVPERARLTRHVSSGLCSLGTCIWVVTLPVH